MVQHFFTSKYSKLNWRKKTQQVIGIIYNERRRQKKDNKLYFSCLVNVSGILGSQFI